ncbi:MAG: phosphatase PAP2 family protein [Flavobacteriaceae bacterium]
MKFWIFVLTHFIFFGILTAQTIDSASEMQRERTVEATGDILHFALPAAAGLTTVILKDKEGGIQFIKSFTANMVATYALKYAFDKPRPEGATDGLAFPSGHTSVAFQGASFIQRRYGWKYGIPAYLMAGFVGYSRIEGINDRHDGWDVLGGILVGIGSTYLFTTPYENKNLDITFSSADGYYTIGVKYQF